MIRLRGTPEDFRVDEVPLYPPSGEGEHTFLRVEKRLRTTEQVARDLARAGGVKARDVGYAGRKDRIAVTTQWFSVPGLAPEKAVSLELHGARVLEAVRHGHKLRTGQLRGNRFVLRVRGASEQQVEQARARLAECVATGMPNRFGSQRFGRDGDNAERARQYCAGELRISDRRAARFLISAWQSEVFNRVLAKRPLGLGELEVGDLAMLRDSGAVFLVEDLDAERPRAEAFEISPTGPIFGSRMTWPSGAPAERERSALRDAGLDPDSLRLPGPRARGARRALRVRPEDARIEAERAGAADAGLLLHFGLPSGSYATVLVEELFGAYEETPIGPAPELSVDDTAHTRAV